MSGVSPADASLMAAALACALVPSPRARTHLALRLREAVAERPADAGSPERAAVIAAAEAYLHRVRPTVPGGVTRGLHLPDVQEALLALTGALLDWSRATPRPPPPPDIADTSRLPWASGRLCRGRAPLATHAALSFADRDGDADALLG